MEAKRQAKMKAELERKIEEEARRKIEKEEEIARLEKQQIAQQTVEQQKVQIEAETEADRIGIELAARAGYDPRAAVTLWDKMGKAGGGGQPQFLSTHPNHDTRVAALEEFMPEAMKYYTGN